MKLNIGCGERVLAGYVGVDIAARNAATIRAPAHDLPIEDGVADEVLAIHLIEHIYEWEVDDTLKEWARVLKKGGTLAIEAPDIFKACRNVAAGVKGVKHPDQLGMWGIFGDPTVKDQHMLHKWGWSFSTLLPRVKAAGFVSVIEAQTHFHTVGRANRDFRLEARRG